MIELSLVSSQVPAVYIWMVAASDIVVVWSVHSRVIMAVACVMPTRHVAVEATTKFPAMSNHTGHRGTTETVSSRKYDQRM